MTTARILGIAAWLALLLGCASAGPKMSALEQVQYDYSAAIRWGDFEGAWLLVDPDYRRQHPLTDTELERFKHVQVSGYSELGSQLTGDASALREVQVGVINRHTMAERSVRYTERWRYDAASKRWWIVNGLPDFWQGQ